MQAQGTRALVSASIILSSPEARAYSRARPFSLSFALRCGAAHELPDMHVRHRVECQFT